MPEQKLNLLQLAALRAHSFAAARRRSCDASSPIPICAAYSRTSCHTARSVNASLPTRPFASTRRKIGPFSIPATSSHPSISCFTHSGTAPPRKHSHSKALSFRRCNNQEWRDGHTACLSTLVCQDHFSIVCSSVPGFASVRSTALPSCVLCG
jgi:hypothetical protein